VIAAAPAATLTPPTTAATPFARHHGASFVDHQRAAHQVAAIAGFDGVVSSRVIMDFDESEPAGLSGEAVAHYIDAVHGDSSLRKEIRYVGFSCRIGEISYKKFHSLLLNVIRREAGSRPRTRDHQQGEKPGGRTDSEHTLLVCQNRPSVSKTTYETFRIDNVSTSWYFLIESEIVTMASTVWKGHLTFGLVSFPVKLFTAARPEGISFNQLHKSDNSRVKQVLYCQAEDKPIPRSEIVKGYEYEKDRYVVIEDEDIKKMAPTTAKVMEILEFVKTEEVDPVYFESSFYMAPDEAGEKPYALLYKTLKRTGFVGVAKIAMHNREHIVIFRPGASGLMMHTMYFANEVRKVEEFRTDTSLVKEQEEKLAEMLVQSLAAAFEPEKYKDTYRENLQKMIDAKISGQEVVTPPAAEPAKVVDIMEALKKSLAIAKKPVASEAEAPKEKAAEGRRHKAAR